MVFGDAQYRPSKIPACTYNSSQKKRGMYQQEHQFTPLHHHLKMLPLLYLPQVQLQELYQHL